MHEGAPLVLKEWSDFYVIAGSSAAALTGLMFVVITIVAGGRSRTSSDGVSTFSTPTVVHFCAALLVSLVLSAPWRSLAHLGTLLTLIGIWGVGYAALLMYRMGYRLRHEVYTRGSTTGCGTRSCPSSRTRGPSPPRSGCAPERPKR